MIEMISRNLFISAHQIGDTQFYPTYKKLVKSQWKSYEELKEEQGKQLKYMIDLAYKNVPYYHKLFDDLKLSPGDVKKVDDLEKLPILTKEIIKQNWDDFKPANLNKLRYYENATGGSTGTPLRYRLSKFDRFLSGALLYRGWGYGGYELGDKMVFLAGASLDVGTKSYLAKRVHEVARNIKKLSSFDMGEKEMRDYVGVVNSFKPKFIRGYASSIYFFAKWIEENNIKTHQPLAVFTTAEKLYPDMRERIGTVFGCDVYDAYGLNDGGLGAYECSEHSGLHIDTERAVMEVVDKNGNQLESGEGEILATSLYNFAMPFIRYDTGDLGHVIDDVCGCGRGYKLLKEVVGRGQEFLIDPTGRYIHGAAFYNDLMKKIDNVNEIEEIQVIQKSPGKIVLKIVSTNTFDESQLCKIREIVRKRFNGLYIEFKFVDAIERTGAGKYKFIINDIGERS